MSIHSHLSNESALPTWFVAFRDVARESGAHLPGVTSRGRQSAHVSGGERG